MIQVNAEVSINGAPPVPCGFAVEVEKVDVSQFGHSEPDMAWEFVDAAGHFHAFDHDGDLPTLIGREEPIEVEDVDEPTDATGSDDWDEFGDSYPITKLHCLLCDEEVEPRWKYVSTPYRQFAAGRTSYLLSVDGSVPTERFSVVVTIREQVFFGFADGSQAYVPGHGAAVPCGPMSWRKRTKTVVPAA